MLRRVLALLVLVLSVVSLAEAQAPSVTAILNAGTCPSTATQIGCVRLGVSGLGGVGIQINGTFSGTLTFEGSIDGVTFTTVNATPTNSTTAVTTTTSAGLWSAGVGGLATLQVRFSSYTSGTATVFIQGSPTSAKLNSGSGGGGGSGTVTSVSWTGGLVSVANPTTTPAFTVAGTSGGIPYFSSASTWASSGALTSGSIVVGGGAGSAPALYAGTSCTNQVPTALSAAGAATCTTLTSAYVNNSIALTGTDINTSNQVTATHLAAGLPVNQGGTGGTSASITLFNNITGFSAAGTTGTTSTNLVFSTSPTLVTPALGVASATSLAAASFLSSTQSINATSTDGLLLTNTTAAANNAQQWSPRVNLTGNGWSTTNSASRPTSWIIENQPVQGAANPSSNLVLSRSINGGAYTAEMTYDDANARWEVVSMQASGSSTSANFTSTSGHYSLSDSNNYLALGTGIPIVFSSTTAYNGTADAGIARNAAGIVEINNGTPGTLRDLKTRQLFASGDNAGIASTTGFSNVTNTTVTNAYTVNGGQAATTPNTGWIKIYVGTTVAWVPYWANATP